MRILFTSWPALGHLHPMIPLARAAQRAGHDVVISSGSDLQGAIERFGFAAHRSGPTLVESYAAVAARGGLISSLPADQQQPAAARWFFGAGGVQRAADLDPFIQQWRPDLVVHEYTEVGGPAAAIEQHIPHLSHGYGPAVPGLARFAAGMGEAFTDAGRDDPFPAIFEQPYLDICPPGLQPAEPLPWADVRPLRPSAGESRPDEHLPADFDDLPFAHTVYLTLGTITNQRPAVFRAAIDGIRGEQVNVVVTTGPGVDPTTIGTADEGVLVVPYLSQALILPRVTAVVSHAGAGTMLGALVHGLPQLCLPQGTDQPTNAAALVRSGAGLSIAPAELTAGSFIAAFRQLLADQIYRRTAVRLSEQIAAMPDAGSVLAQLGDLVHA